MAKGMIQDNMARPQGNELDPKQVQNEIKMPPELQNAYERVVIAGMKLMFSKETHKLMLKEFERKGPIAERLGKGIAGLMIILFNQSNKSIPPQVIIPAGTNLLMQAVQFMRATKLENINNKDVGDALDVFIRTILKAFGVSTDKLTSLMDTYDQDGIEAVKQQLGV